VVGGPILLVLTLQHDARFGSEAATASIAGLMPVAIYILVFAQLAIRGVGAIGCVLGGWAGFLAGVAVLSAFALSPIPAFALTCAAFALALRLLPHPPASAASGAAPPTPPSWDIPVRMVAAAVMVLVISAVSASLGSHLSGLLAPFPIITAVLTGFTLHHAGPAPLVPMLRGFLIGFYAFASFSLVVGLALPGWSIAAAFALAVVAAVATAGTTRLIAAHAAR